MGDSLNTEIMATHVSTGLPLRLVYLENEQHTFEPARVHDLNMDPVGENLVNLLLKGHQLRHLIVRSVTELDWIFLVAELWPLFAQLHTLELGCSEGVFGFGQTVKRGRLAEQVPLYRAARRLRETIRLRWLSVGERDLSQDDIKKLADAPELAAAQVILQDDHVSSAVCAAWNRSDDKGPPALIQHPMPQRCRAWLQDCDDTGGSRWYNGFFGQVTDEWQPLASAATRENN